MESQIQTLIRGTILLAGAFMVTCYAEMLHEPGREPWQGHVQTQASGTYVRLPLPAAPVGKRLIVESVEVTAYLPAGQQIGCSLTSSPTAGRDAMPVAYMLPMSAASGTTTDGAVFASTARLTLSTESAAGTQLTLGCNRDKRVSNFSVQANIFGYSLESKAPVQMSAKR